MTHDSRTGCSGRLAGGAGSGLASTGRLAFWARLALVVLLGLLAGLGVAWVSARRPEWRPVAVFALIGFGFGVVVVRRWWPHLLWRYAGVLAIGLGCLVARRWGVPLGWEVFLASAMLGLQRCFHGLTDDERRELLASWPTSVTAPRPVQNSDENPSELDATAGPNVSSQLDLPFSALGGRPLVQHADPVAAYEQSRGTGRELWATPEAQEYIASLRGGRSSEPVEPTAQQHQQIQAALRQGDQDIAANRGHDLGEVLADLGGEPSPAQPPKSAT